MSGRGTGIKNPATHLERRAHLRQHGRIRTIFDQNSQERKGNDISRTWTEAPKRPGVLPSEGKDTRRPGDRLCPQLAPLFTHAFRT
jgi:hypothetical protein